jgi:hypothetical protein
VLSSARKKLITSLDALKTAQTQKKERFGDLFVILGVKYNDFNE